MKYFLNATLNFADTGDQLILSVVLGCINGPTPVPNVTESGFVVVVVVVDDDVAVIIIIMDVSCHRHFFPVLLLNQR